MIIRIFLTLWLSLTMQSCRSSPETTSGFTKQDEGDSECQKWKNEVSSLSQGEIEKLSREGAVRKEGVGLILSDSLVEDCRLRNEMAAYILRGINGQSENAKADRDFAAHHSQEIIAVLRRIWPSLSNSKALVGDGNFNSEKYNLLADPGLSDSDLTSLISDILDAETIDNDLAWVLFSRPLPGIIPTLLRLQKKAATANNSPWQILNLALLQRIGEPST